MCGRFTQTQTDPNVVQTAFNLPDTPPESPPRYNIAPGTPIAVIVQEAGANRLDYMHWGLIPAWSKDRQIANRLINARGETVHEKPSFRAAFKARRCLIVADGFYEWRKNADGSKTPMYIQVQEGALFGMAGLWENWQDPASGESLQSCTIITTQPNTLMQAIHDRMPVILPTEDYAPWLDPHNRDTDTLRHLLHPYNPALMRAYTVSTQVNNPRNDTPALIQHMLP